MIHRFEVELLEQAFEFLKSLNAKHRNKILQNMDRSKFHTDPKLFKKLEGEIWEFRTLYSGFQYRLLAFWDKTDKTETIVFATHGMVKKTSKVDKKEIDKAERIRQQYLKDK
ncbi:MAG: type II toxin-antitoxin system RelE/ParE family toxin [Cyclobacteriaceae bacterium]|nr:type II toxin-antitoxin system RelE/ParE family toxin [Cyclobacteriaceae bacterium]